MAFLFPGQGSQSVGMLADLASGAAEIEHTFAEASEVLGYDLWAVCQDGPADRLNRTEVTQPAMLSAGIATWRTWRSAGGVTPAWFAGHSLGEYSALVAADALDFADAVRVVALRGSLMQAAVPEGVGAMAAVIGMDDEALVAVCEAAAQGEVVSCANFNAPGQVVIAGNRTAVQRAGEAAQAAGARRVIPLPVSVPSHCALMKSATDELRSALQAVDFRTPSVPVIQNADVRSWSDPADIVDALVRQLWQPVRWTETILALVGEGVDTLVECGPGKVLAGLNRRISRETNTIAFTDLDTIRSTLQREET